MNPAQRSAAQHAHFAIDPPPRSHGRDRLLAGQPIFGWLLLVVFALFVCFITGMVSSIRLARRLDSESLSITENATPSIVYLAAIRRDIRLIERDVMRAEPASMPSDREAVDRHIDELGRAIKAYRTTPDYPGEGELYEEMALQRPLFIAAVESALAAASAGPPEAAHALDRLAAATDSYDRATEATLQLNAEHVETQANAIQDLQHRSEELAYVMETVTLVLAVTGFVLGVAATRQHLARAEERNRTTTERAAELEIFAGRVAHDLRTPLTAIQLRTATAQRHPTPESLAAALTHVSRQVDRMADLIAALLAFARAGARPQPGSSCNTADVMAGVYAELQPLAAEAKIDLVLRPADPLPVACASGVLASVLSNLARNAVQCVRAANAHDARVTLLAIRRNEWAHFEVEDTGPGLPPGTEARVFEPFVRLPGAPPGGIGLGLATVKRLVEAHGGWLGVDSAPGAGCRFWFEIPLSQAP